MSPNSSKHSTANHPLLRRSPGVNNTVLEAAKLGLQFGYAESFRLVFYALIPFGVLAAALCLGLPNISTLMTNKVVAPARGASMRNTFHSTWVHEEVSWLDSLT